MTANLPYRLYRRNATDTHRTFWKAVERDATDRDHMPPAEVLELANAGTAGVPLGPDRVRDVHAWAQTIEGWQFEPHPMYVRLPGPNRLGPALDLATI